MDSDDPLALVQPVPFHLNVGTVDMQRGNAETLQGVVVRIDTSSGSFVQIMEAENAANFARVIGQVAEQALMKNALVRPTPKLVVPGGGGS